MLGIDITQILLHMLNFVILAGGLIILLYNPIVKFIDDRQKRFEELERKNEEAAEENRKLKEEYEARLSTSKIEAEKLIEDYQATAVEVAKEYLNDTQDKAADILDKAEADAEKRKAMILDSAQEEISELVLNAAQKLVSDTSSEERNSALYDEFIRRIGNRAEGAEGNNNE